jgi:Rv2175c C-terminal domain of unknown function
MTDEPLATDPVPEVGSGTAAALVPAWLNLPEVSELLGVDVTRVRQAIRDRQVLAVRLDGVLRIPADFVQEGKVLKGLPGLLVVLADAGYSDEEALRWIFTVDDSLPGTPVQALRENRGREVRRRAMTLAW